MSMLTSTNEPQIKIRRKYNHPIDKVWHGITSKEALSSWLMETTDFEPIPGNTFQFTTAPRGRFDGIVSCKVLQVEQPHFIQYSWKATEMPQPTVVTWELTKLDPSTTLLTLSHDGFVGINGWVTRMILGFGWKGLLKKKLNQYLAQ